MSEPAWVTLKKANPFLAGVACEVGCETARVTFAHKENPATLTMDERDLAVIIASAVDGTIRGIISKALR
jgi:hypothetical protein